MPRTTLADVASDYVRKHQYERQCRQLDSNSRVTLTVIQNQWAKLAGQEPMTIFDAPTNCSTAQKKQTGSSTTA